MTANLRTPDPECDLDYVSEGCRPMQIGAAISNSFGFGGSNSCLVFRSPQRAEKLGW
jgi:3-oxoacyl-[acyl-carrier-protein] synthase-1/3-oxoacyl-[acyl-carrier-protein] synthase II